MLLHLEEYETLENVCNEMLKSNQIRFAGVINKMGNLIAGGFKSDMKPLQDDAKQRMLYMQIILEISMRKEFDSEFGDVNMLPQAETRRWTMPKRWAKNMIPL